MDNVFIEGNLRERPLADLWRDETTFAYNRGFSTDLLDGRCRGCEHGAACRGGCRDHAAAFTGHRYEYPFCLHRWERDGSP